MGNSWSHDWREFSQSLHCYGTDTFLFSLTDPGHPQHGTTGKREQSLTPKQALDSSCLADETYECELPEGEDETKTSFSHVCKDTLLPWLFVEGKHYSFQEEQSLTHFHLL